MAKKMPENNEVNTADVQNVGADAAVASSKAAKRNAKMAGELEKPVVSSDASSSQNTAPDKKAKKTKSAQKNSDKPNIFKRMWKGLKGIVSELKKVTWPKGKDVAKSTAVVLVVVVAFFIVLFGIDYVLAGILNLIVKGEWAFIFIS